MTSTHRSPASRYPATDSSPRTAEDRSLLTDLMAFTPSATLGRELLALVLNLVLVGLVVLIIQPDPIVSVVILATVTLYMLGRLVAGFRTRGYGRSLKDGR